MPQGLQGLNVRQANGKTCSAFILTLHIQTTTKDGLWMMQKAGRAVVYTHSTRTDERGTWTARGSPSEVRYTNTSHVHQGV